MARIRKITLEVTFAYDCELSPRELARKMEGELRVWARENKNLGIDPYGFDVEDYAFARNVILNKPASVEPQEANSV